MGRGQRIRVGAGFWVVTRESRCERAVRGWIPGNFLQKCPLCPLYPPPLITIRNETFFWVDVGWRCWLCLTDAQRYYTTLQFWQVTGSADGVWFKMGVSFWLSLESYTGFRNQPLWSPPNLDHTRQMGCIQDIRRASGPILSATPGAGETPAFPGVIPQIWTAPPAIPGGYAIISDAPLFQDRLHSFVAGAYWAPCQPRTG